MSILLYWSPDLDRLVDLLDMAPTLLSVIDCCWLPISLFVISIFRVGFYLYSILGFFLSSLM